MIKFILIIVLIFFSKNSFAYLGLGPLIPLFGSAIWALITFFLLLLGIFLYPIKLLFKKIKESKNKKKNIDK